MSTGEGDGSLPTAPDPAPAPPAAVPAPPTRLLVVGAIVAVWAVLPPFSGPELLTETRKEIADHVVPSILILLLVAAAFLGAHRSGTAMFTMGLGIVLAGIWMTSTHVPLVAQALRDEVTWGPTVYHSLPGLAVLGLGAAWAWRYMEEGVGEADAD